MLLPEPQSMSYLNLMNDISKGSIKIPQFQRQFVWEMNLCANLIDSILKGYPIGTFILWKTKERLRSVKEIGNIDLPASPEGDYVNYVLDGQQRITSIYAILNGLEIERDSGKTDNMHDIFIDLEAEADEKIVKFGSEPVQNGHFIRVKDLLEGGIEFLSKFPKAYYPKIEEYQTILKSYQFSVIILKEAPIDIATEVFTRLNITGKKLSLFEIMVAKTYDEKKKFDLAEQFEELITELSNVGYDTISDATVLQVVAILIKKECQRREILQIPKDKFIATWPKAVDAIKTAIDYFIGFYRIPVSQLLPYNALIVPFAYFFFKHPDKPIGDKQKYLQDFFWRCALTGRYSSAVETKLGQDVIRIDSILKNELPKYNWPLEITTDFIIDNGWFSAGRSFIKAILGLYAYHQPKSFNDNSIIQIDNNWLKIATSKNYHHFFPKAYLKKKNRDWFKINHILNITIVDDFLNKREIKALPPATYMKKFQKENPNLEKTLKTHLITDLSRFGIWENDYDKFFDERAKLVAKKLKKRIIEQDSDHVGKTVIVEDSEEEDFGG